MNEETNQACANNLVRTPVKFLILDSIECKLSFTSGKGKGYRFFLNEHSFEDLIELKNQEERVVKETPPSIARSECFTEMQRGVFRMISNVFIEGNFKFIEFCFNGPAQAAEIIYNGKEGLRAWYPHSLEEAFSVPYNFTVAGKKFTFQLGSGPKAQEVESIELKVEGRSLLEYPYLSMDYEPSNIRVY